MTVTDSQAIGLFGLTRVPRLFGHLRKGHLPRAFLELYRAKGPVARLDMPFSKSPITVLMGERANLWARDEAGAALRPLPPSSVSVEHQDLRDSLAGVYAPARIEARFGEALDTLFEVMRDWQVGDVLRGRNACEALVHGQMSRINFGVDSVADLRDLVALERRDIHTRGLGLLPESMHRTPDMRIRQKRLDASLSACLLAASASDYPQGQLVNTFLDIHATNRARLPFVDLHTHLKPALLASLRLADLFALTLCTLASHPELHNQVKAEADRLFSHGPPTGETLAASDVDIASRVYLETLRMFPPVPFVLREVMNPIALDGRELPLGSRVLIATCTTHYLEEVFTDPSSFDIDRYLPIRGEHMRAGAFAPFGVGSHMCPGEEWTRIHLLVNLLTLVHHFDFKVTPACYGLGMRALPVSAPDRRFKIHITRKRNPLPTD